MGNQHLIADLIRLKKQKLSKAEYAKKLGVTVSEVDNLFKEIKKLREEEQEIETSGNMNFEAGTANYKFSHNLAALSEKQVFEEVNLDPKYWKLSQIWHKKTKSGFLYSANFKEIKESDDIKLQDEFFKKLKSFKSPYKPIRRESSLLPSAAILIPKQDFHFDKKDTSENLPNLRIYQDFTSTKSFIKKAKSINSLDTIFYILGSDYFNSEFTKATTKGTPQENVGDYHEMFNKACIHEVDLLSYTLECSDKVEVIFIPGNHDYYKCWHLISWLEAYFKDEPRIVFDTNHSLRKYFKYGNTAVMLHHGNEVKPQVLANIFPKEFKKEWSNCENYYIVTGDKHREIINDFGNIRHYGVKALSSAKSFWDEQNGYLSSGEATAFIITKDIGIDSIFKHKTQ